MPEGLGKSEEPLHDYMCIDEKEVKEDQAQYGYEYFDGDGEQLKFAVWCMVYGVWCIGVT